MSIKNISRTVAFCVALMGSASLALAAESAADQITRNVHAALGGSGVEVQKVEKVAQFQDLYEVVVNHNGGKKILYTNASGSHLILGDLFESKSMLNITAEKMDALNAIAFDSDLNPKLALTSVYGNGARKIAVFEDPNCGYCKRFRRDAIEKLDDATVYTYVYPVLGKDSSDKAGKVLCSSDPDKMWKDWMINNQSPSGDSSCNPPLSDLIALGRSLGVTGTPTIFFEDGTRASGAIAASELSRRIAKADRAADSKK